MTRAGSAKGGFAIGVAAAVGAAALAAAVAVPVTLAADSGSQNVTVGQAIGVICSALDNPGPCSSASPVVSTSTVPGPTTTVTQTEIATATVTATATRTAVATVTVTASPSSSRSPSPTPTPSRSASPTPTATSSGGFPDASNTGAHGVLTVHQGNLSASGVIKDLDIKGCLTITGDATVTDVLVEGGCGSGRSLDIRAGGVVTVTDATIRATSSQASAVVVDHGTTVLQRLDVSGGNDGIDVWSGDVTLADSYVHDILRASGSHNDTVQVLGGGNVLLSHDTFMAFTHGDPMNACLQIGELNGSGLNTVTMTNSYCDGGNYSVNANGGNGGATLVVTDNVFGDDYRYGVQANLGSPFRTTWSGNKDAVTGRAV